MPGSHNDVLHSLTRAVIQDFAEEFGAVAFAAVVLTQGETNVAAMAEQGWGENGADLGEAEDGVRVLIVAPEQSLGDVAFRKPFGVELGLSLDCGERGTETFQIVASRRVRGHSKPFVLYSPTERQN